MKTLNIQNRSLFYILILTNSVIQFLKKDNFAQKKFLLRFLCIFNFYHAKDTFECLLKIPVGRLSLHDEPLNVVVYHFLVQFLDSTLEKKKMLITSIIRVNPVLKLLHRQSSNYSKNVFNNFFLGFTKNVFFGLAVKGQSSRRPKNRKLYFF